MTSSISDLKKQIVQQAQQIIESRPVFLDTETTGLDRNAEIVEISVVDIDGSVLFESLVRPLRPIPPETTRIHHITNEMVQKAPTWVSIWPNLRPVLVGRPIAIYNEEFDIRMMKQTHGLYKLAWRETFKTHCIMQLYARFRGEWDPRRMGYKLHSLDAAGKMSQISIPNSHRASDDTKLARALLFYMAGLDWNIPASN
jgi:DNA polymerase III subunit epsilon